MGSNANAFKYFWKVFAFAFAFELFKWKVFAFAFKNFFKYFSNTFEIIFKYFFYFTSWPELILNLLNTMFVPILIVFYHILKCMIIIVTKTYYSLLLFLCFIDMASQLKYLKVFEKVFEILFEKYLHLHLKKIKVFAFALEKFRSICNCI